MKGQTANLFHSGVEVVSNLVDIVEGHWCQQFLPHTHPPRLFPPPLIWLALVKIIIVQLMDDNLLKSFPIELSKPKGGKQFDHNKPFCFYRAVASPHF